MLFTDYLDDVGTTYIDPTLYPIISPAKLTNAFLLNDRQYELDPTHVTNPGDQRGQFKNNDVYFIFNIKIGYLSAGKKYGTDHSNRYVPSSR